MASTIKTIADLHIDPRNPRKRGPRASDMIQRSLQEVGAARSIVIDEEGNILAGNGTVEAAGQVGIQRVKVVDADGETIVAVRRTGLSNAEKQRLAVLDNRTGELAEWDGEILSGLMNDGLKVADLFTENELDALLNGVSDEAVESAKKDPKEPAQPLGEGYFVTVTCPDEAIQLALLERLEAEGYECRASIL